MTGNYSPLPQTESLVGDRASKHVLIITEAFPPDPLSGAARPARFARFLPEFGYEPIVICRGLPSRLDSLSVRRVPKPLPGRKVTAMADLSAIIQRRLLPYDDKLPWAVHVFDEAKSVLSRWPISAVFSTSPAIGTHLAAMLLKLRYGLPWIADFRDPLWGNPFRSRRWFFPYDEIVERVLFRHSDAVIANTDPVAEMWRRHHPGIGLKIEVIHNGFDPEDRIEALPLPLAHRRVLAHVGSLYGGRHPGALFASLVRLINAGDLSGDQFRLCLVGPIEGDCLRANQEEADLLRAWGCLEYDGKRVTPSEARQKCAQADSLLLLDLNEKETDLQIPAKLFDYIQIGRPILAFTRRASPTDRILRGCGVPCRIVYQGASNIEIDSEVRGFFDLSSDPARPNAWFEEQFDGRSQTRRLAELLDSVRGVPVRSVGNHALSPAANMVGDGLE